MSSTYFPCLSIAATSVLDNSAVNDKVSPEVAHNSGDLPVVIIKVEDSSGEEVEELVTVSDAPGNGRLGRGEEEVPQGVSSVIFK